MSWDRVENLFKIKLTCFVREILVLCVCFVCCFLVISCVFFLCMLASFQMWCSFLCLFVLLYNHLGFQSDLSSLFGTLLIEKLNY